MTDDMPNTLSVILKLLDDADGRFLELGCALVTLKANAPDAFAEVVNLPQLGKRRGYSLIIGLAFGEKPHLHERLRRLGLTASANAFRKFDRMQSSSTFRRSELEPC